MPKLCESPSLVELQLIADYLEREGVRTEILNEHQGSQPVVPHGALSVWAELWVREPAELDRAAELLADYRRELQRDDVAEWRCASCGESNPGNFETCWQCGAARPAD
ncbi:MAG: DUF2007 domain-containing protein [Halioglobus sp.]|nr:DUF2007 domain-containing protein [Halioglobus sp.]